MIAPSKALWTAAKVGLDAGGKEASMPVLSINEGGVVIPPLELVSENLGISLDDNSLFTMSQLFLSPCLF